MVFINNFPQLCVSISNLFYILKIKCMHVYNTVLRIHMALRTNTHTHSHTYMYVCVSTYITLLSFHYFHPFLFLTATKIHIRQKCVQQTGFSPNTRGILLDQCPT